MVEHKQNESQVHKKNPKHRQKAQKKSSMYKTLGI